MPKTFLTLLLIINKQTLWTAACKTKQQVQASGLSTLMLGHIIPETEVSVVAGDNFMSDT